MSISLKMVALPSFGTLGKQPTIPADVYSTRVNHAYEKAGCDWLVVYADREHFGNIAFLSGFEPRFEEAFLVIGPDQKRVLITGNESESYAPLARLPGLEVIVSQSLSLMGQDRSQHPRLAQRLADVGMKVGDTIGLVGWKYLEPFEDDELATAFYVPAVYVQIFQRVVGKSGNVSDQTKILMHPEHGLTAQLDVHQIAAFEWAATRASLSTWRIVSGALPGNTEFEAVARMAYEGDALNVHTMFASASKGTPVIGLRSATARKLVKGDGVTTAVGHWGALSSRAGLLDDENDQFLEIAKGYFKGLIQWYATARIGVTGGELYDAVVSALAESGLKSALNPGHLGGYEEWTNTPVRPGSEDRIRSGMLFQVDVIPTPVPSGWALNCEDAVVFADETLRAEFAEKYPEAAARVEARREFMRNDLGVEVPEEILPLSSTPLYLPPFWLKSNMVLVKD